MLKMITAKLHKILLHMYFLELDKNIQRSVSHTYIRPKWGVDVPVNTHTYGFERNCEIHNCIFICAVPYSSGEYFTVTATFPLPGMIPVIREEKQ